MRDCGKAVDAGTNVSWKDSMRIGAAMFLLCLASCSTKRADDSLGMLLADVPPVSMNVRLIPYFERQLKTGIVAPQIYRPGH